MPRNPDSGYPNELRRIAVIATATVDAMTKNQGQPGAHVKRTGDGQVDLLLRIAVVLGVGSRAPPVRFRPRCPSNSA